MSGVDMHRCKGLLLLEFYLCCPCASCLYQHTVYSLLLLLAEQLYTADYGFARNRQQHNDQTEVIQRSGVRYSAVAAHAEPKLAVL